jgi:fatty acid desaturase
MNYRWAGSYFGAFLMVGSNDAYNSGVWWPWWLAMIIGSMLLFMLAHRDSRGAAPQHSQEKP